MSPFDARDKLAENPFSYRSTKDGRLLIYWHEKQVTIMRGDKAAKTIAELEQASQPETQLILARVTGHFKHGNEHK